MRNLTVTLPESVLARLRVLAAERNVSVNKYVGEVLGEITGQRNDSWREEHRALLDHIGSRPRVGKWNRDEIYEERLG